MMKICMVVPAASVKGGIASVVNGYRSCEFQGQCEISYVESYRDGSKLQKFLKAISGYLAFHRELRNNRPDLVHVHSSFGPSFYRKLPFIYMASRRKIPVINHIHGAEFDAFYTNASSGKKRRIEKAYNRCICLVALSEQWKEHLQRIVPAEKIVVIENYCRIPQWGEKNGQRDILFLGEIGKRKGCFDIPEIFGKAMKRADATSPESLEEKPSHLFMAGDGTEQDKEQVKKLFAEQEGLAHVSFPGWVRGEEKERLLRECGIFLFPSYHEGMPMAVLEAMAYGMAIVSTTVGGIPMLIEDGVSGYLCKPGDVETLSGRLGELLVNEEKREAFGKAARKTAMERYSLEIHVEKLLNLYRSVLKEGR